jgi:hypothetical protein
MSSSRPIIFTGTVKEEFMSNPEFKWLNCLGIGRVILMAAALVGFTIYHFLR